MPQPPHEKSQLRQTLIALRQGIAADVRLCWDQSIARQLTAWLLENPATTIGIYWPMRNEPDLRSLYADWAAAGKQLALPIVIDKNLPLKFYGWAPGTALVKDAMGVWVPANTELEVDPDLMLVPCVGFNDARIRLGYGGGFYDRTLAKSTRAQAIGVAYGCTRAAFEGEDHDVALDAIITETVTLV